ncbi:MAG: hypothetical protein K5867_05820 [Bacteroidales bacterium]|nr:hypothetical protein [Bacteroidales bacterium]
MSPSFLLYDDSTTKCIYGGKAMRQIVRHLRLEPCLRLLGYTSPWNYQRGLWWSSRCPVGVK